MTEPFITADELEDLLDYERHEHSSDALVRKLLKAIGQHMGINEKKTLSSFRAGDALITELFWKSFDRVLETQGMRETIGRVNRVTFCTACKAFHLWYDPLNSKELDPVALSKKLTPALLVVEPVAKH